MAVLLAVAVVGAGAVGVAVAASDGSIEANPSTASATATHSITAAVGNTSTGSWNGLQVDYSDSDADVSDVGVEDVVKIGVDRGDDEIGTKIDVNASSDLSDVKISNDGETLTVKLGGSVQLSPGDEVVLVVEDVHNPSEAGEYTIPMDVNPQSSGGDVRTVLTISEQTTEPTEEPTTTQDGGDGGTGVFSPGFGVAVALAAVLGAAVVALRE